MTKFFSAKTTNKTKAEQVERKLRNEVHAKTMLGAKERIGLTDAAELYRQSKEKSPSYRTYDSVCGKVLGLLEGVKYLDDLTTSDVFKMNETMKKNEYSNQTRITYTHFVRATVDLCRRLNYQVPPTLEFPKIEPDPGRFRILTEAEETALLHEMHPMRFDIKEIADSRSDNIDYIVCLLDTGARCSEISKLKWSQIDLKQETIQLHRTKAARGGYKNVSTIYMSERVQAVFAYRSKHKSHDEWVFPNKDGKSHRSAPSDAFGRACDRAKIKDLHIHDLRHTAAAKLIRNGCTLHEVSPILGHIDLKMTARYASLAEEDVSRKARDIFNKVNMQRMKSALRAA